MSNDTILTIGAGVLGLLAVAAFVYSLARGVSSSLATAKVGEVYNFEYEQPHHGEPERVLAKVISPVNTLNEFQIRKLNARSAYRRNDPTFQRTKHLVTCEMSDGTIRNFYAERTRNVRRLPIGHPVFRAVAAMIL